MKTKTWDSFSGRRLRRHRVRAGYTVEALAEDARVAASTLRRWERIDARAGVRGPKCNHAFRVVAWIDGKLRHDGKPGIRMLDLFERVRFRVSEATPPLVLRGGKLRAAREAAGFTRAEAAVRACVAPSTVRRLEGRDGNVRASTLGRLTQAFGVKVDAVLGWAPRVATA